VIFFVFYFLFLWSFDSFICLFIYLIFLRFFCDFLIFLWFLYNYCFVIFCCEFLILFYSFFIPAYDFLPLVGFYDFLIFSNLLICSMIFWFIYDSLSFLICFNFLCFNSLFCTFIRTWVLVGTSKFPLFTTPSFVKTLHRTAVFSLFSLLHHSIRSLNKQYSCVCEKYLKYRK